MLAFLSKVETSTPKRDFFSKKHGKSVHISCGSALTLILLLLITGNKSTDAAFSVKVRKNVNSINRIVFGTAALPLSEDPPLKVLDAAYAKGFRRFDLARSYSGGESERMFGDWLQSRDIDRSTVNLITKGGMGDDKYGDPNRPLLTREGFLSEVEESLRALKTDYVDLYMFHRDDPRMGVEEFVLWINEVLASGKVKAWGVSNWSFERFRSACDYAKRFGLVPPTANSPQFSIAVPKCEIWPTTQSISSIDYSHQIDWYEENGVELLCWEVLAKGFMAMPELWPQHEICQEFLESDVELGSNDWRLQRIQRAYCHPENYERRELAIRLANDFGGNLAQISMLYPLTRGRNISVLFGPAKVEHLDDMCALQHLVIDDEAMEKLRSVKCEKEDSRMLMSVG